MTLAAPCGPTDSRLAWVDIARGLGIIAVVVWHTAGGIARSGLPVPPGTPAAIAGWDTFAYRAMPIFFLVSGLFVLQSLRRPARSFLATKARTLLWPYVVWSIISMCVGTLAGSASNYGVTISELPRLAYDPILQYWFLYSLLAIMVAFLVLVRVGVPPVAILGVAAAAYAFTALTNLTAPSYVVDQTGLLAVFFAIGAAFGPGIIATVRRTAAWLLGLVSIAATGVTVGLLAGAGAEPPAFVPLMSATVAMVGMIAVGELVARAGGLLAAGLGAIGRLSLQIYLAQILFASGTRVVLLRLGLTDFVLQLVLGVLAGFIGPMLLVAIGNRARVQLLWAWPAGRRSAGIVEPTAGGPGRDLPRDHRTPPVATA
jgi:uncharacterized membrane protein YcfT